MKKFKEFLSTKRKKKIGFEKLHCSLCNRVFRAASKFHRFCRNCKMDEELFRFAEWLPGGVPTK